MGRRAWNMTVGWTAGAAPPPALRCSAIDGAAHCAPPRGAAQRAEQRGPRAPEPCCVRLSRPAGRVPARRFLQGARVRLLRGVDLRLRVLRALLRVRLQRRFDHGRMPGRPVSRRAVQGAAARAPLPPPPARHRTHTRARPPACTQRSRPVPCGPFSPPVAVYCGRMLPLFSPTHLARGWQRVQELQGTFYAAVRRESWQGDVCVTKLTVHGPWFWMGSFRVPGRLYAVSPAALPLGVEDNPSLCDFPDALGPAEGKIDLVQSTRPDALARLRLTYISGLPMGVERFVNIFDDCPKGIVAHFEAVPWVALGYTPTVGLAPPRYSYESGSRTCSQCVYPTSGYKFNENLASGMVRAAFAGPATGYRKMSGTYTGFFVFGSTRRRSDAKSILSCRGLGP